MKTLVNILITVLVLCLLVGSAFAKEQERDRKADEQPATSTVQPDESEQTTTPALDRPNSPLPSVSPEAGEEINWLVISGGGDGGSSTNYSLSGTIGQTAVDFSNSTNYQLSSGFWQNFSGSSSDCCVGRVGDANGLGGDEPSIGDVAVMIDAKYIIGSCYGILDCLTEADINQSGGIDADCDDITIGDIAILIDYLFIIGPSMGLNDCL
ncbi:MAG: hypothetical protein J7J98_05800 [candidate division Zixibacteria bacterium]|nr:hypothetical protein [candidate division Zixibacteria bacterium]